jgi:hypothetical protein
MADWETAYGVRELEDGAANGAGWPSGGGW